MGLHKHNISFDLADGPCYPHFGILNTANPDDV